MYYLLQFSEFIEIVVICSASKNFVDHTRVKMKASPFTKSFPLRVGYTSGKRIGQLVFLLIIDFVHFCGKDVRIIPETTSILSYFRQSVE